MLAVVAAASVLAWTAIRYVEPRRHARAVRDQVRQARRAVDSCRMEMSQEEAEFRAYDDRVDSLRVRVRGYEALHPDGVPADSFGAYLEVFDEYNEAVPRWEARADSLRTRWRACRALADEHNVLVDSLRGLLVEMGELPDSVPDPGEPSP